MILLLADESLSEKAMKNMVYLQEKFSCPLLVCPSGRLGELLRRPSVKAVGVQEKNLASAILQEAERLDEWKIYSGGRN